MCIAIAVPERLRGQGVHSTLLAVLYTAVSAKLSIIIATLGRLFTSTSLMRPAVNANARYYYSHQFWNRWRSAINRLKTQE